MKIMTTVLVSIIRKENLLVCRESKIQLLLPLLLPLLFQWTILTGSGATIALMYGPFALIIFFTAALLGRSFYREKASGVLMATLSTGISPGVLWAMKTFAVFLCAFILSSLLVELEFVVILLLGIPVSITMNNLAIAFILSPLCALGVIALTSFLYWTWRFANMIVPILPMIAATGFYYYTFSRASMAPLLGRLIVLAFIAGLVMFCCAFIIGKLSRACLLGMR